MSWVKIAIVQSSNEYDASFFPSWPFLYRPRPLAAHKCGWSEGTSHSGYCQCAAPANVIGQDLTPAQTPTDGLKAAEMLAKMCGWNEPERVNVQSVEVKVDAALIEQLRAGYAELGRRQQQQLAGSGEKAAATTRAG